MSSRIPAESRLDGQEFNAWINQDARSQEWQIGIRVRAAD
jgi:hypothetical protein